MRLTSAAFALLLLVGCRPAAEAPQLTTLDAPSYRSLQAEFNRASDATRILVLLSPT